jgi:hypothetical protein
MKDFPGLICLLAIFCNPLIAQDEITWSDDVACIVYNNCTKCHHPGGIAPVSFMAYEDVYAKRASIRIFVEERSMPPSPAMPGAVPFRDDNLLSDEEVATIVQWVLNGAPSGDLGMAPAPPVISETEAIPNPNEIIQIDPYASQAEFSDDYRCFAFETAFGEDKWVTGIEIVPGNKSIVHHVILYEDDNDVVLNLDNQDPLPGYQCFGGVGSFSANFLGGWVPGQTAQFVPDGMGLLIPAGTNLIIQTHYPEETKGMIDSTKINLRFAENGNGLRQISVSPYINHITSLTNGPLAIPANTVKTFHAEGTIFGNVSLIGVLPHMHLIGTAMSCYAVIPAGDTIEIFDIPEWDFDWQLSYQFRSPIHLPFGTKIIADATYDNTLNNPHNPSNPPVNVFAGEATTDEMFLIFFSYMTYQAGDENIIFEDAPPVCETTTSVISHTRPDIRIYPNPAHHTVTIFAPWDDYAVTLHDMYGRVLMAELNLQEIPTEALSDGMYLIRIEHQGTIIIKKVIVSH